MKCFKIFRSTDESEYDIKRKTDCISEIKQSVAEFCGTDKFLKLDSFTVAFAGSRENAELVLEISIQCVNGKNYLYASVDDEDSWQEWDYDGTDEFKRDIVEYISNRVNRTVKTVTEVKDRETKIKSFYLNENGEWILFEEDTIPGRIPRFLPAHLPKPKEVIKEYKLKQ